MPFPGFIRSSFSIVSTKEIAPIKAGEPNKRGTRAGRRSKDGGNDGLASVTREQVLAHAMALAQSESVDDITIARLARELGVTTSLIHYFVGSRDELLSTVLNRALKLRSENYPPLTGRWREDLEAHLRQTHCSQLQWKGITSYVANHNRHRLFQRVGPGEVDYGLVFFDRLGRILKSAGLPRKHAALAYHLVMLFMTAVASSHVNRQEPVEHRSYLREHLELFPRTEYEGAYFLMPEFSRLNTATTFEEGMRLMLDGISAWIEPQGNTEALQTP